MFYRNSTSEEIFAKSNQYAIWAKAHDRIEPELWPVINAKFTIHEGSTIFTIGSCFARNIENSLHALGFNLPTMKFTLPNNEGVPTPSIMLNRYTPAGIHQALVWFLDVYNNHNGKVTFENTGMYCYETKDGTVLDLDLSGTVSVSKERFLERRQDVYNVYKELYNSDVTIITMGLIETWFDIKNNVYLMSVPANRDFHREKRVEFYAHGFIKCYDFMRKSIDLLNEINPNMKILITTSPVPLIRTFTDSDVIIANSRSKGTLSAVGAQLYYDYANVDYFPSYESVMLTRDRNVWQPDLRHVNPAFVQKIVSRLLDSHFEDADNHNKIIQETNTLVSQGKAQEAREYLLGSITDFSSKRVAYLLGFLEYINGNFEAADNALAGLKTDTDDYMVQGLLANIYLKLSKTEAGEDIFENLVSLKISHRREVMDYLISFLLGSVTSAKYKKFISMMCESYGSNYMVLGMIVDKFYKTENYQGICDVIDLSKALTGKLVSTPEAMKDLYCKYAVSKIRLGLNDDAAAIIMKYIESYLKDIAVDVKSLIEKNSVRDACKFVFGEV